MPMTATTGLLILIVKVSSYRKACFVQPLLCFSAVQDTYDQGLVWQNCYDCSRMVSHHVMLPILQVASYRKSQYLTIRLDAGVLRRSLLQQSEAKKRCTGQTLPLVCGIWSSRKLWR